jgi:5-methylcytosine-specific restriction endonuclease McrA
MLLLEFGHRCMRCGLSEWLENEIPLEVDHKDGNSDNWTKENLALVCPNCHALTPTYKAKNRFHGSNRQKKRRERYALGKTW